VARLAASAVVVDAPSPRCGRGLLRGSAKKKG
jgi:hypothetical protein